jgi:hypothetical protein
LADANATLLKLGIEAGRASWVYSTYITQDTESAQCAARIKSRSRPASGSRRKQAKYDNAQVDAEQRRQLNLLKLSHSNS